MFLEIMAYRTFNKSWDTNINTLGGARDYVAYDAPFSNDPSANNINGVLSNGVLTREFKGQLNVNITPSRFNMAYPQRVNNFTMNPQVAHIKSGDSYGRKSGTSAKRRRDHRDLTNKEVDNSTNLSHQEEITADIPKAGDELVAAPSFPSNDNPIESGGFENPDQTAAEVIANDIEIPLTPVEEVIQDIPILSSATPIEEVASIADVTGDDEIANNMVSQIVDTPDLDPSAGVVDVEPIQELSDINAQELTPAPPVESDIIPEIVEEDSIKVPATDLVNIADTGDAEVVELVATGDGLVDVVDSTGAIVDTVPIEQVADVSEITADTDIAGDLNELEQTGTVEGFRFLKRRRLRERYNPGIRGLRGSNIHISTERFTRKEATNIMIVLIAIIAFCMLSVCCGLLIPQIYVRCCGDKCNSNYQRIPETNNTAITYNTQDLTYY